MVANFSSRLGKTDNSSCESAGGKFPLADKTQCANIEEALPSAPTAGPRPFRAHAGRPAVR